MLRAADSDFLAKDGEFCFEFGDSLLGVVEHESDHRVFASRRVQIVGDWVFGGFGVTHVRRHGNTATGEQRETP